MVWWWSRVFEFEDIGCRKFNDKNAFAAVNRKTKKKNPAKTAVLVKNLEIREGRN